MNQALAGRKVTEVKLLEVRSARTADFDLLRQKTPNHNPPKVLRDRHHHIAWLFALGKSNIDIAAECRMSPNRISQHRNSPAFQELIAKYRRDIEASRLEATRDFVDSATRNMIAGEELIHRELAEFTADPNLAVDLRTVNRIVSDRMDRFGYGKHSTSLNVNVGFATKLEACIARSRKVS